MLRPALPQRIPPAPITRLFGSVSPSKPAWQSRTLTLSCRGDLRFVIGLRRCMSPRASQSLASNPKFAVEPFFAAERARGMGGRENRKFHEEARENGGAAFRSWLMVVGCRRAAFGSKEAFENSWPNDRKFPRQRAKMNAPLPVAVFPPMNLHRFGPRLC